MLHGEKPKALHEQVMNASLKQAFPLKIVGNCFNIILLAVSHANLDTGFRSVHESSLSAFDSS